MKRSTLNFYRGDRKGAWWAGYGDRHGIWTPPPERADFSGVDKAPRAGSTGLALRRGMLGRSEAKPRQTTTVL